MEMSQEANIVVVLAEEEDRMPLFLMQPFNEWASRQLEKKFGK